MQVLFKLNHISYRVRISLIVIILLVFAISTASVLYHGDHFLLGSYEKLNNDDVKYVNSAKILLNKHTLAYNSGEAPSAFIMPGMPLILSGFMLIFGQDNDAVIAFRVLQAALQALSIYLIFVIANHLFNCRAAIIACIASALYLPDYFSSGVILSETLFRTIFILLICFCILALKSNQTKHYVIAAVLVGLACYFKPHAILFPIVLFILWLVNRVSWKTIIKHTTVISVTLILLLCPWWIRNYATFDEFIPFTKSAGNPMLLGALIHNAAPPQAFFDAHPEYTGGRDSLFTGSDADMAETTKKIVQFGFKEQPLQYLQWYTIEKLKGLYLGPYYWKTVFGIPGSLVTVYHILFVAIGGAGLLLMLIQAIRQRKQQYLLLLLTFAYFTVIYVPFVAFSRYGYPNVFIIFLCAAYVVDRALDIQTFKGFYQTFKGFNRTFKGFNQTFKGFNQTFKGVSNPPKPSLPREGPEALRPLDTRAGTNVRAKETLGGDV
ncbi:dolichyl-phosphate-mannose-protein mannosyltransferase [Paenibacillus prosopidis]|uniref:Dolichyl-phosphate-mannose-protein mannosyltransferase n=1 Tax=Paenibacillus prosopidis TaxID=630520 RepID=A0A368VZA0_9BACL|nr:dolichyl-phosphate-mannose-protein mannosyltransferase [Paenibacillus prosopidis]